jgi:hypothetical protein
MSTSRILAIALAGLALAGIAQIARAEPGSARVVVVADAAAPAAATRAALRAAGPGAELRLPRTPTEQLSVTHWFAARGYEVVAVGLSRRTAIEPVARRYPQVHFIVRG